MADVAIRIVLTSAEGYTLPTRLDIYTEEIQKIIMQAVYGVQIIKQGLSLAYPSIGSSI
jgi:hypothetical protein